jgi:hypothetical protein
MFGQISVDQKTDYTKRDHEEIALPGGWSEAWISKSDECWNEVTGDARTVG